MNGRMPVERSKERRMNLLRYPHIVIAGKDVARFVRILPVQSGQDKPRKSIGLTWIEALAGDGLHGEETDQRKNKGSHIAVNAAGQRQPQTPGDRHLTNA